MAFAFCNMSGEIRFGQRVPTGSTELARGRLALLEEICGRLAPGGVIPGMRELPSYATIAGWIACNERRSQFQVELTAALREAMP